MLLSYEQRNRSNCRCSFLIRASFLVFNRRNTENSALEKQRNIEIEFELELTQTQMTQKPMLRAEVYAHAVRASQNQLL